MANHHCQGVFRDLYNDSRKVYFECWEKSSSGEFALEFDEGLIVIVGFCPICGAESPAHAKLINQDTVRMVEHV